MRAKCLSCEGPGGRVIIVMIEHLGYTDAWSVRVCQQCQGILESMLDRASTGHQWGFPEEAGPVTRHVPSV